MKKKIIVIMSIIMAISIASIATGCGKEAEQSTIVNPMVESDLESISSLIECDIIIPEGAENPSYYIINNELGEIQYTTENGATKMTYRMKKSDTFEDISGMNYDWDLVEDSDIYGWPCKTLLYHSNDEDVQVCNWLDNANNIMYSLSAVSDNLNGFDILGAAYTTLVFDEPVYDYPTNDFEARVEKTSFDSYDEIISLLEGEEAYALVNIKGYDGEVLMITESAYDNLDGNMATIEATAYTKKSNGTVTADSIVFSQSTATPISLDSEGVIYCYSHHDIQQLCYGDNGTENPALMVMKSLTVTNFDEEGNPTTVTGFYRTNNSVIDDDDTVWLDETEDNIHLFDEAYEKYATTKPINFTS